MTADLRPESPMPPPPRRAVLPRYRQTGYDRGLEPAHDGGLTYWRDAQAALDAERAEVERLRALAERTVAMIARGRVIDQQAERMATKGGSATPVLWAAEAYDELLADLDRDLRAALEGKP
jgi:hypothetical protein